MKIVPNVGARPKERKPIDYDRIADFYNACDVEDAVEIPKVYNVTLFKKSLASHGITSDVDFYAFNKDGKTYVQRLTTVKMSKD